ncbi:MAG TPA: alpha/beta fold hydrolase [Myxococcota bacterium]|nr:alpha/beta fold hydrolase [Myxococcota bacterium]
MAELGFSLQGNSGKGVVLVHGLSGAPAEMKYLARQLHRRGFSVRVPLLAGHGEDQRALLRTGWRDWLATVDAEYESLEAEVDEVYTAGICVGGALGIALAAERPELRAVAVYSMTFRYDGWNMKHWYSAMAPWLEPFADLPLVRRISFLEPSPFGLKDEKLRKAVASSSQRLIEGALDRLPLGSMCQMYRLAEHCEQVGARVSQPVLLMHAREDDMADPRNAVRLRAALAGPVDLRLVEDSYHMLHVDKQRDYVANSTAAFFGASEATALRRRSR